METMIPGGRAVRAFLILLLLALPGCFSLSRGAPIQQHYVLSGGAPAPRVTVLAPSVTETLSIGLRPPRLAEYLASPFIVVRQGTHRVGFSEFDRWGEDLARGVNRSLATHIVARSPEYRVESAPWPAGAQPEYLIQVQLLRFEGVAPEDPLTRAGEAHLLATWEILRSGDGTVLAHGTTEVRSDGWAVGDFDGLVGLLDAGLDRLAEDLLQGLERALSSADGPVPSR